VERILGFSNPEPADMREPLYKRRLRDPFCDALCWKFQRTLCRLPGSAIHELLGGPEVTDVRTRALNCRYEFGFSIIAICRNPVPALMDRLLGFLGAMPELFLSRPLTELLSLALLSKHRECGSSGGVYVLPAEGCAELLPGDLALIVPPKDAGMALPKRFLLGVRNLQDPTFITRLQPVSPILSHPHEVQESVLTWSGAASGVELRPLRSGFGEGRPQAQDGPTRPHPIRHYGLDVLERLEARDLAPPSPAAASSIELSMPSSH